MHKHVVIAVVSMLLLPAVVAAETHPGIYPTERSFDTDPDLAHMPEFRSDSTAWPLTCPNSMLWTDMRDVHVSGNYAYCSMRLGLMIVDVSNPQHPEFVSRILMPTMPGGVQVVDGYAFITGGGIVGEGGVVMTVVDVTDPVNPEVVATFLDEPIPLADLAIVGGRAYIAARTQGLIVANVDDPTAPYLMGQYDWSDATDVEVVGDTAWVVFGGYAIKAIDISDPFNPQPVGGWAGVTSHTDCIQVIGDYIYVADLDSGLTIMKIDGSPPSIVGRVPEAGRSYEVQVVGDFAYLTASSPWSVTVVDVSDPEDPVFIGGFGDYNKAGRGIHIVGDLAYLAHENTGLLIVDIDNPYSLQEAGWFWESHHVCTMIEVADGYCYVSQVDSILIMSLADPIRPATVGVAREGNLRDFEVVGNRLYVSNVNSFSIWDVTDKTAPIELSYYWTDYQEMRDMRIRDDYVYAAMDIAGMWIFDISDPTDPDTVAAFEPSNCDYKIETVELYQEFAIFGYYCYEDFGTGLLVVNISNPAQPYVEANIPIDHKPVDLKIRDTVLFVGEAGWGVSFWSVADAKEPQQLGYYSEYPYCSAPDAIEIRNDLLYMAGSYCTQQHVRVLDISDLNNPAVIGTFSSRGWYEDLDVAGKHVYCAAYWGLVVLDQNAGSLCGDVDGDGGDGPDISDLVYLVSYMFDLGPPPPYPELADVDGSGGNLDIADLVYLVDYMFMSGPPPICQ